MAEAKKGRQTPTQAVTLPYDKTHGAEAVELYNATGRTAQPWQELLLYDILAENEDGLWVHTKFGYSVPRRNGKNEIAAMRELWGLQQGENILHTAHRTTTSHTAWERLCNLLDKAKIAYKSIRATGRESVRLTDGEGRQGGFPLAASRENAPPFGRAFPVLRLICSRSCGCGS